MSPADLTARPPASSGLRAWLRRLLGGDAQEQRHTEGLQHIAGLMERQSRSIANIAEAMGLLRQLVDGQRADFDQLGGVLQRRDQDVDAAAERHTQQVGQIINIVRGLQDKLAWHESRVPQLRRSAQGYAAAVAKEKARREQLVTDHPELSEEGKAVVRRTGKLPELVLPPAEAPPPPAAATEVPPAG